MKRNRLAIAMAALGGAALSVILTGCHCRRDLHDCQEALQQCRVGQCFTPPGKGPDISVGPGGGSQAVWRFNEGQAITAFDSQHRIRSDAWGALVHLNFQPDVGRQVGFNKFKLEIVSALGTHTIMITKSLNGQIGWTMDDAPIDQCDYKAGGYPDCENDGLPSEFNGTINSWQYEVSPGNWSSLPSGRGYSQAQW